MRGRELLRAQLRQAAQQSHPHGQRQEVAFPVRPEGTTDIDLRDNAEVRDQSQYLIIGLDMVT